MRWAEWPCAAAESQVVAGRVVHGRCHCQAKTLHLTASRACLPAAYPRVLVATPQLQASADFRLNFRLHQACQADVQRLCSGA